MGFKVIETFEEAEPLSQAGLLWCKFPDTDWFPDDRGYWHKDEPNGALWWDTEKSVDGYLYAILLED